MALNKHIQVYDQNHLLALRKFESNMLLFGKATLPSMFSVKSPQFHRELTANFQDEQVKLLNVIAPRGHAKSSLAGTLWVLHHLMFHPNEVKFVVLVSKTEGHAKRLISTLKDALNFNASLRKYVGYWGEFGAKTWKENEIVLKDNSMVLARGTGQMVVGLKHLNQRPTLVILDDPEDMDNTKTAEAMNYNLEWLLQQLLPTRDPLVGRVAVIGTPQHQRCMVETLKGASNWKTLQYKALQDDGTALWPEWMSAEKLLKEKEGMDSIGKVSAWYREYQCQVVGSEDQLFQSGMIRYYDGHVENVGRAPLLVLKLEDGSVRKVPIILFMGIDPASSTSVKADYSVIMVVGIDDKGNRYVIDYFRRRVTPMVLSEEIMKMYERYRPAKTRIESVGYQEMLREYLRSKKYIPGLEIKETPRTMKSKRLEALQPYFAQGLVYLKKEHRDLVDELIMYPRGKHDDLLDGLYYAMKGVYKPLHTLTDALKREDQILLESRQKVDWMVV